MTTSGIMKRENGRTSVPATSFSGLVDHFFQNNLNRFFEDGFWGFDGLSQQNNIPVNLRENDKGYDLQLVAPGLRKEDFKISVDGDLLTISFEHKEENREEEKNQRWLRKEYKMQSFSRSFNIDDTFDANKIAANYRDGILHLTLPKKEGMQRVSRNIEIK
jgi:HSP20 family protein